MMIYIEKETQHKLWKRKQQKGKARYKEEEIEMYVRVDECKRKEN